MGAAGDRLRDARQQQNLSTEDVARATRIKSSYLEALEQGEYSLLPGPAYITGFLRTYAAYLGLSPDEMVQEYYSERAPAIPAVHAATRVLANGYERQHRIRLLWGLGALILVLAAGFAIKQYNDTYAHASYAPLNVTPANIGAAAPRGTHPHHRLHTFTLKLRAVAPVWVGVTADGQRVFHRILRPRNHHAHWTAHHSIYVVTYDGAHLRVTYNGRQLGAPALKRGLIVNEATPTGWRAIY